MRPTIAMSRISAPDCTAWCAQTTSALCFAFVEQPKLQKPRYTHGGLLPCGAETVASGVIAHFTPSTSAPRASSCAGPFIGCGRYG
jgi:hypothetical protein